MSCFLQNISAIVFCYLYDNYCFVINSSQFIVFFVSECFETSKRAKKQCTVTALPIIKKL